MRTILNNKHKLVWDLPLRLFHWLFAISILASWYTSEQEGEMIERHMQLGYFILGLVLFRLIWGFAGTKHSRFSQFFPTPSKLFNHLRTSPEKYPGHNPLGSLMVFFMIFLILLQAISGLFINDDIFSSGPYYGTLSAEMETLMKYIHHTAFNFMIGAITFHILAILYYRFKLKIDLITPMITGKKPEHEINNNNISHSKIVTAIVIAIGVATFVYWLVVINAPIEEVYFY